MSNIKIKSVNKLSGHVFIPSSKSHTMRAIVFASLAQGTSVIENYLVSPDTDAMIAACQQLGAIIRKQDQVLEIQGFAGKPKAADNIIDAGNSGQVLRFITGVASLSTAYTVITGDESLRYRRPMYALIDGLNQLGAFCVSTKQDDHAPIIVRGPIQAGKVNMNGQTAQHVSSILIAAAFSHGTSEIYIEEAGETPWVALTLDWFKRLGIRCENNIFNYYRVTGNTELNAFEYKVPGDWSSAAFMIAAALITRSNIILQNLDDQDVQGDRAILNVFEQMGAKFHYDHQHQSLSIDPANKLNGVEVDINAMIDALPILAVVSCYAQSPTHITGAASAKFKESNRIAAIATELKKMGAHIETHADGIIIYPTRLKASSALFSHRDHRIAMALAIASLGVEGQEQSIINDAECINKSYPGFVQHLQAIGAHVFVEG